MKGFEDVDEVMRMIANSEAVILDGHNPPQTSPGKPVATKTGGLLPKESESAFQGRVIQVARLNRWRVAHFRPGTTSRTYIDKNGQKKNVWTTPVQGDGAGFPDLVLVREMVLWRELKSEKGKLSEAEKFWQTWLKNAGQDVGVWRPSMWEQILEELKWL